jgi:hypothetical protein
LSDPLAQHEARIIAYAARIARGERLFEPTPTKVPESDRPGARACIACGRVETKGWGRETKPWGWRTQPLAGAERFGVELHCWPCFQKWGWGTGESTR